MRRYLLLSRWGSIVPFILIMAAFSAAQPTPQSMILDVPPVDAANIQRLRSVRHVDFAALGDLGGLIQTGWFALSPDGTWLALVRQDGGLIVLDTAGSLVDTYTVTGENGQPGTVLDAAFGADSQTLAALHTDGEAYSISLRRIGSGAEAERPADDPVLIPFSRGSDMPVRVWLGVPQDGVYDSVWLEVAAGDPSEGYYVVRLPTDEAGETTPLMLPSGPQNDRESFVRIGRIPAPLAITSTADGLVKLWNLETGDVTAQVQLDAVPVFGRVDETTGRFLAWRDPDSESLNLLDFERGENQVVAALGGDYIQAILLSPQADVILGVAIGDQPIVVAWDVTRDGMRYDLGRYRSCSRVPDMIALSRDGRSLVIGCDSGLDIWQVRE